MSLTTIHLLADFGMLIVLWLVQLVIYPSFLRIQKDQIVAWHRTYTSRVVFIILPLMIAQLGLSIWFVVTAYDLGYLLNLVLVIVTWILTFFVSVPFHRRVEGGNCSPSTFNGLIVTNWPRTFVWTAIFALALLR